MSHCSLWRDREVLRPQQHPQAGQAQELALDK
jgi:hypothetical protein